MNSLALFRAHCTLLGVQMQMGLSTIRRSYSVEADSYCNRTLHFTPLLNHPANNEINVTQYTSYRAPPMSPDTRLGAVTMRGRR